MSNKYPIVPAYIPKDEQALSEFLASSIYAHEIQIDVVDGKYVPDMSWPFSPVGNPKSLRHLFDKYTLEVDLMTTEPVSAAKEWQAAGADMLVFHMDTVELSVFENFTKHSKASVGIACHGDVRMDTFFSYVRVSDYVQLMGIKEVGRQGQPFDEEVLDKIRIVKEAFPNKMISIDGSVNAATIKKLASAGADRFVVGSAIVNAPNPEEAYCELVESVN